ncbi:MAG: hypothetical protein LC753_00415 [Acidobacteria bacterium]|nr:hypothetical protein [Acidobacteriota bacterium]MCA1648777.1 hypothetical protein [Acidobacteriota bacterium]
MRFLPAWLPASSMPRQLGQPGFGTATCSGIITAEKVAVPKKWLSKDRIEWAAAADGQRNTGRGLEMMRRLRRPTFACAGLTVMVGDYHASAMTAGPLTSLEPPD